MEGESSSCPGTRKKFLGLVTCYKSALTGLAKTLYTEAIRLYLNQARHIRCRREKPLQTLRPKRMTSEGVTTSLFSAHEFHIVLSPRSKCGSEWKVEAQSQLPKPSTVLTSGLHLPWLRSEGEMSLSSPKHDISSSERDLLFCPASPLAHTRYTQGCAELHTVCLQEPGTVLGIGNEQADKMSVAHQAVSCSVH